jgi:hypothetical protein
MEDGEPDTSNPDSEHGTLLHSRVAEGLTTGSVSAEGLSEQDIEAVNRCLSVSREMHKKYRGDQIVEQKLDLACIHPLVGHGTVDFAIVEQFGSGCIGDWKFGRAAVPPAQHNLQLQAYAIGLVEKYDLMYVEAFICQPFLHSFTSRIYTASDLKVLKANIEQIIERSNSDDALAIASGKACKYCKGKHKCPAMEKQVTGMTVSASANELTPEKLAQLLPQVEVVEAYCKQVKQRAYAVISGGVDIPGYGLVPGRKSRYWVEDQFDKVLEVCTRNGVDPYEHKPLSVAAVEKVLGKAKSEVEPYWFSKNGEPKLERITKDAEIQPVSVHGTSDKGSGVKDDSAGAEGGSVRAGSEHAQAGASVVPEGGSVGQTVGSGQPVSDQGQSGIRAGRATTRRVGKGRRKEVGPGLIC